MANASKNTRAARRAQRSRARNERQIKYVDNHELNQSFGGRGEAGPFAAKNYGFYGPSAGPGLNREGSW